jgi:hypothetical protein
MKKYKILINDVNYVTIESEHETHVRVIVLALKSTISDKVEYEEIK